MMLSSIEACLAAEQPKKQFKQGSLADKVLQIFHTQSNVTYTDIKRLYPDLTTMQIRNCIQNLIRYDKVKCSVPKKNQSGADSIYELIDGSIYKL